MLWPEIQSQRRPPYPHLYRMRFRGQRAGYSGVTHLRRCPATEGWAVSCPWYRASEAQRAMAWCMRYCTVSIRSAPAPCRSARRSIRLSDSPSSAALPGESSEGARVPRQPEPGARQEAALKPQPTSLPELRERPPEGPMSTSEPQSWDPARPPGTEPPSAHRGMVPGPSSAPHSLLTSLGYHCSVQAPTNSRAVGVRGEGTPVPTANPEIHGTTQPTCPPNHPTSPRHSSVRLPKGTRSTQRAAPQGPSGLLGNQPLSPGPRALLLDSIHAHPYRTSGSHRTVLQSTLPSPLYPARNSL